MTLFVLEIPIFKEEFKKKLIHGNTESSLFNKENIICSVLCLIFGYFSGFAQSIISKITGSLSNNELFNYSIGNGISGILTNVIYYLIKLSIGVI